MLITLPLELTAFVICEVRDELPSYRVAVAMGHREILLPDGATVVYECTVSAKNLFACMDTVRKRIRVWMQNEGVFTVSGLEDNEPSAFHTASPGQDTFYLPTTYNDLGVYKPPYRTARITIWRDSDDKRLYAIVTRGEGNGDEHVPVPNDLVVFIAMTVADENDERTLRDIVVSSLRNPKPIRILWYGSREEWIF